ncbi:unnamed protein product [Rhizoctonia solani]|uniref:Serine-threonine/tyrosine-protein kinase catalytic domain-containing protein n=1 Tax=Rhizoctonia solani TaxID=456999 RepID=A0A8H3DWG0_9AGAM|nr:unnamed protein product [Rhizoctonia solani]
MMWDLMVLCWSREASARPTAAEVVNAISPTSLPVSSSLVASVVSQQSHSQSSSRTIRVTTRNDAQNDARTNATSTPLESASETNNASTSSNIGPIRRDRNRDTIVASQTPTSAILRCVEDRLQVKMV